MFGNKIVIKSFLTLVFALFFGIFFSFVFTTKTYADAWYAPTSTYSGLGTAQNKVGTTAAAAEGVNIGDVEALISDDNYHWGVASTTTGINIQANFANVSVRSANTFIIQTEFDLDATAPNLMVQICDFTSGTSVDNGTDGQCTTGGWRTLNNRKVAITTATATAYQWNVYDGYFTNGSNTAISTPLSNFLNSGSVTIRLFASNNTTSVVNWDYIRLESVVSPIYTAGGFNNSGVGTVTGDYRNITTVTQGASDNTYLQIAGTAGSVSDSYLIMKNVKPFIGANTIMARVENKVSSCATTVNVQMSVAHFPSGGWTNIGSSLACTTTEAIRMVALNNINISEYISSGGELWLRFLGSANSTATIDIDQAYVMIGATNTDTAKCEISFGTVSTGDCANTRTLDTIGSASTWNVTAEDESGTMSHYYYPQDNGASNATTEEATSVHTKIKAQAPGNGKVVGMFYSGRFMSGTAGTVIMSLRDNSAAIATAGGFTDIGGGATTALTYTDNITVGTVANGAMAGVYNAADRYVNNLTGEVWLRLRTSTVGATSNNSVAQVDFLMISLAWNEDSTKVTRTNTYSATNGTAITGTAQNITSIVAASNEGVNTGSYRGTFANDNYHWALASTAGGMKINLEFGNVSLHNANVIILETEFDGDATSPATLVQVCDFVSSTNVDTGTDSECTTGGWRTLNNLKATVAPTTATAYHFRIYDGYFSNGNTTVSTPLTNFIDSSEKILIRYYSTTNTTTVFAIDFARIMVEVNPVYTAAGFTNIGTGTVTNNYTYTSSVMQGAADNSKLTVAGTAGSVPDFYLSFKNVKTQSWMNTIVVRSESACSTNFNYNYYIYNFTTTTYTAIGAQVTCTSTTDVAYPIALNNITISDYVSNGEIRVEMKGTTNTTSTINLDYMYVMVGATNSDSGASECFISFGTVNTNTCTSTRDLTNGTATAWTINTEDEAANQGHDYYGYDRPNNATAEESQSSHVKFSTTLDDNTEQVGIYYAARFMSGTAGTVSLSVRDNFGIVSAVGGFVTMGATATTALTYVDNVSAATATGSPGGYSGFANTEDTYVNTDTDKMWMRMFTTTGGATTNNSVGQWDFAFVSIAWVETSRFDISGTVYSDEVSTVIDCSTLPLNISVYVDDEFAGGGWCTASDGTYTVSNVYAVLGDKTTAIEETIYIDGHTEKAATFTRDDAVTNLTGIDLIQNRVVLRQDDSGPITNSDIAHADSAEDSDLQFTVTSGALSVTSGSKLIVETGDTFTPGGAVTTDSLEVKGTFSPTSNTVTLNGVGTSSTCTDAPGTVMPFCINGGTFNASTSTVNFIAVAATATMIENTTYNVLQVDATSDSTAAVTFTLHGDTTVTSVLTIGNSGSTNTDILDGGVNTITLSGSGTPFDITSKGSFTSNFSTVNYTGSSATTVLLTTYYNLGIYPGANSINHTLGTATSQTLTVGGNLDLGNGTNTGVGILGNTYNPTINVTGNTSIKANTTFTSTSGTLTISGSYSNAGTFTHNSGTVNMTGIGTTDPTLYWNYSENTGTTINSRVGGGQGGTTSNTSWTTGVYDTALDYNGSSARTYASNKAISNTDNFSMMAWINVTSLPQTGIIMYNGDDSGGYGLSISADWGAAGSELRMLWGGIVWDNSGYTLPAGKWIHVAAVRDSGTTKFYVNGVQTPNTNTTTPYPVNNNFEVGKEPGQARYFNGKVDEPKVYNYALTAAQVKSSMYTYYSSTIGYTMSGNMTTTSSFNNLTFNGTSGQWDFGANSATVANDLTITNGTVIAPSTTLTVSGNYSNSGTFTNNSGTVLFNATDSGNTIAGTLSSTSKFYNLTFNGVSGAWSFTSNPAVEVANDLTITNGTVTSTSGNLTITGNYSNSATFTNNSGTVIMNATDSGNTLAGTLSGTSKFYNLTFNGVSGAWSFTSNPAVEVANDLTITNGTLTSTSHASGLIVTGNYSNAGTFTHNSGTVIFNATDAGNTLAGTLSGSSSFYNLTFSGASGAWSFTSNPSVTIANALSISNGTLTATSGTTTIGGNFTKTGGTFTHNSGTVLFNDNTKISTLTYNADIIFSSFTVSTASKQMKFDNVDKTTIAGTFTINGSACGTKVELHSDSDTNQFDIDATGTVSVTYADIQDSNAITGLSATNSVAGGGGNNTGWTISGGACAPSISVTGVCYAFDESTGCGDTGTITIAFGNSLQAQTEPTVSPSWTVTGLTAPSTGTIVTIFIDGASDTDEAIAVTKYDGAGDITGVKLYKEHLTVGSLDNQTLSNSELGTFDNSVSGDEDIFIDVTTNNLVVDATSQSTTEKLTIISGNTLQPGGTITTHDLTNLGTFLPQANTITIQGSYLNSGTLTASTSQFNMTGTTSETLAGTLSGATGKFYNLTFNGSGGAWSFTSNPAVEVANDLLLYGGTVTSTSSTLTIGNNYEVYPGIFTHNSGTVIFNATDSGNTIAGRPESTRGFYNLTFDGVSGAWTLLPESGYLVTVANNFTITNGTVTSVASPGWLTVSGNYSNSGTFTHNSGTVRFDATDSGNTLAGTLSSTSKFYNLTFSGSGGAWSFTSNPAVEVANNFTISNGTVTSTSSTLTVTGNYSNSGTFTHNSGTLIMNATDSGNTLAGTLSGATGKFYNLTFNGSGGAWSFTSNPAVEVANDLTITNGTLTSTSHASGLTVSGNFSNSGTFTNNSGTVIFNATDSGNTLAGTLSGSSKFYNLTFDGVSGAWSFTSNPSVEVNNNLTITNGTVTSTSGNLTVTGNYSNAGTFTHNSGTVIMNAIDTGNTLAGTLSGSSKFYNLTFNGSGGAWSFTSNPAVEVNNDLTITNGTVTSTSGNLTITGNYSNSGSFKNNLGTVIMNATDSGNTLAGTLSGTTGKFYNLTFNGSGGAWSFTSNPTVEINNDMTITLGNVTSTSGNLVIGGNYSNSGTFTHNSGTTIFNGVHTSNTLAGTLSGSSAFYNLKFDKCPTVNSPVGYWNFEEGSGGTTLDNCANGFTGTLGTGGNTPTWTTGKYGNGLSFDGNDFVNVGSQSGLHFNYTDSFSISGWVNVPSVPSSGQYQFIAIQTGSDSTYGAFQYSIMLDGDTTGKLCAVVGRAGVGNNEVCKTSVISINTWYHIVGVYDGTYISVYIDGTYVNRVAYSQGGATAPSGDFIIGGSNNNYYLNGKADNITVYNYSLTPEQVVEDMNRAGGGWSYTSNPNVDVANNFTITNGIHTSTSGNLTISNNYSNLGTFTHNSGTITMNATDAGNTLAGTMSGSPGKFYNLTFNGSGGAWSFTSNPAVEVANNFTITNGTVTSTSHASGLIISGNYSNSGTFTHNSGTVLMNATDSGNTLAGTLSGTSAFYNLTFNGSGGDWSFTSNPAVEVANDFTITTGTVTSTSNASGLIITGNYSNSGTFTNNSGLVKFNATDAGNTLAGTLSGTSKFYNLTFDGVSGAWSFTSNPSVEVNNDLTITNGTLTSTSGNLTVTGNYSNAGTFTHNSGTVIFNATDAGNTIGGTLSGTSKFYNLTFNGVSGAWSFTSNPAVEVNNDLTITNGTLTSTSHASGLIVTGNYSNSGTFTHNSGTVIFNATDAGNTLGGTLSGGSSFYNLTFSGSGGAWSFTSNPAVTIANALSISNGTVTATSGTTTIGGNFTKTGGTFTHNSGTVVFNDNTKVSTLTYNADTTFSAFTVSTASKQMKFDNVDKTTVAGTFTINGAACGTFIQLYSDSTGNQFDIDLQGTVSIDYADIKDSNAITAATANSSNNSLNNTNWTINGGSCNTAPNSPTSLAQKTTGDVVIVTGGWNNTTSIKFTATGDDPNNPDTIYLCVEYQQLGTGFTNTETGCGTGVAYSGTPVTVTVTLNSIPDAFEYHWQARLKDTAGAYSSWVSYDVNAESARDYGIDTTAPTLSTINDGTSCGSDITFNNGSLSTISACWAQATATISGLTKYQYSVGTTSGATDVLTWTDLVDGSANVSLTINSLTLQTSQQYYINVKAIDNATNTSGVISTNGQLVAPTISFSLNSSAVTFANLNGSNSYTDTKTSTLTTSTNAYNGYVVRAYKTQLLTNTSNPSYTISDFSAGSYAAPSAWSGTGYGYSSSDTSIQGAGKFPSSGSCLGSGTAPCFAPFSSTAPGDIVADHSSTVSGSPISNEQFTITYKVATPATQAGGQYTTTIVYTIVPQY